MLSADDEESVRNLFLQSALLPILEAALRSGSILEMAKEFDLYSALLKLTETFATKQVLITLLIDIGPEYQPRQRDSLVKLLKSAAEMSKVFHECLQLVPENSESKNDNETQEYPRKLSQMFLDVYEHVSMTL